MRDNLFKFDKPIGDSGTGGGSHSTYIPLEKNSALSPQEIISVNYGNTIESLHLVKPAFMHHDSNNQIKFTPTDELDYHYVLATLKNSKYLVLLGEKSNSSFMKQHLKENHKLINKNTYYLDIYFNPGYGAFVPRYILFEEKKLENIPNTMVLIKEN